MTTNSVSVACESARPQPPKNQPLTPDHRGHRIPAPARWLAAAALWMPIVALAGGGLQAPDFDIRAPRSVTLSTPAQPLSADQHQALRFLGEEAAGDLVTSWSGLTGAPSRIGRHGRPLTPANQAPAAQIADTFITRYRGLFNLSQQDVSEMRTSRHFGTSHNGVTHLTLQQQVFGIDVFRAAIRINVDASGQILNVSGEPVPDVHSHVHGSTPSITVETAVDAARAAAGVDAVSDSSSLGLIYFPVTANDVRLGWRVTFQDADSPNLYESIVDAITGTVLWRQCLTQYNHIPAHGLVYPSDSPNPNTPLGTSTGTVSRQDVSFSGTGRFPHDDSHYDWWNGGARTTTTSNNVDAYADRDGDDAADAGSRPTAASGEDFTFPIDLSQEPDTYQDAAVVNLFYWNNIMHDYFYRLGFDEAAGNFQSDNLSLGGSDGDPVMAEAQDNADGDPRSLCNANMSTQGDGTPPRMQMYLCDRATPERDGDLEAVVIGHEYTHGVHTRLVPTSGNQRANEGWSDYFGLSVVAKPEDPYNGKYTVGNYLFNNNGIRSGPYSTDVATYGRTYADINDASASCAVKTCSSDDTETCSKDEDCSNSGDTCDSLACSYHEDCEPPNTTISQGPCRTEVHRTGELWAEALWIARMNIIGKSGFAAGGRTMDQLVIDGMKMSAADPTFLDGRDAILAADQADNGGANVCLIWDGFAKMGMGFSAVTTGVDDINPLEAFDVPSYCSPVIQVNTNTDLGNICVGSSTAETLSVFNTGSGDLIVTAVKRVSGSSDIIIEGQPETPVFIGADAHVDFTVRCEPSSIGTKTATIRIDSNDTADPNKEIEFTCTAGEPDINVSIADSGSFGDVCKGDNGDLDLTLLNQGTCDLTIDNIEMVPGGSSFELPGDLTFPLVLSHDADFNVPVRYVPDICSDVPEAAMVKITSDDPDENVVSIDVSGTSPCPNLIIEPPDSTGLYSFSPTVVDVTGTLGCATARNVTLRNNGACPLTIDGISALGLTNAADFSVTAPTQFPIVLPSGEETLNVTVRFTPQADPMPLAPTELLGEMTVSSDDPDASGVANLCGEGVTQSGVRILVTDVSSGLSVPVAEVDDIILRSKGINRPAPINLRFTNQPLSSVSVCGSDVVYHVDQETLPATETTGSNPTSSYEATARDGNLQTSEQFSLGQCEFREFQLQLQASGASDCLLAPKGAACTSDGECCSGHCQGPAGSQTCK